MRHYLREAREERNLPQWKLAALSGVGRVTINRIENGRQNPHVSTVKKMATALHVEPENLMPRLRNLDEYPLGVRLTPSLRDELMPVIESVARRHALNPADVDDLVGAGEEGLLEACRKFDPEHGTPLQWFARFYAVNRVRDRARRLYRHYSGFAPEDQGIESHSYQRLSRVVSFRQVSFSIEQGSGWSKPRLSFAPESPWTCHHRGRGAPARRIPHGRVGASMRTRRSRPAAPPRGWFPASPA